MRKLSSKTLLLLLTTVTLFSCARFKKNEIGLVNRNFVDEVDLTQNLVFTFNKSLVPEDRLGIWDSTHFVEFEPAVKGKFKWTSRSELVFSPSKGFEPSTTYKAALQKDLLKKAENKSWYLSDQDRKFNFHTPFLRLDDFDAYWAKSAQTRQVQVKINLHFNYDVKIASLKQQLHVKANDQEKPFTLETNGSNANVLLSIDGESFGNEDLTLKLNIDKGLEQAEGGYTATEAFELMKMIPSRFDLQVLEVTSGFENNRAYIEVITSQRLLEDNLADAYTLEPKANTEIRATENGLVITGELEIGTNYVLTLKNTIKGEVGGVMKENYTKDVFYGNLPPAISFANSKAIYLSEKGEKNIAVNIIGLSKVELTVKKVFENNILAYIRQNRNSDYYYDEYDEYQNNGYTYGDDYGDDYSKEVLKKTIDTKDLPKVKGINALNLNMNETDAFRGIYLVKVASTEEYYLNAYKLVSISDIGLIAKQNDKDIVVFANAIRTAEPLSGVEVNLVSTNNQTIYTLKTNSEGVAVFSDIEGKAPGFKVAMVTARTPNDFNFMLLSDTRVETSRYEVDGKRGNASGFEAFVYGDRNIYRPGENIYFNAVVRNERWDNVGEIPLKIKLVQPNGKEYQVIRKNTNKQGAADGSIALDAAAVTGTYSLEVYNGNDVLMSSQSISVEEFMPDRIKVDMRLDRQFYAPGQQVKVTATALNLFGPPASDRNYEMEFFVNRKHFAPKAFPGFAFDVMSKANFSNVLRQGKTNERGEALETFELPASYNDLGLLEGKVFSTVFDENGRPVNRVKQFDIYTQPVFYGVGLTDYYVGTNQLMQIPLAAVNKDEKTVSADAEVQVVRYEWQTVVEKVYSSFRYKSRKEEKVMMSRIVRINGNTTVNFVPSVSGEYEVRVKRPGAANYTSSSFYAYGYGYTSGTAFEVSTEGQVLITLDKEKYNPGDKAKVLFKTPFAGRLLVTVERNKVYEHFVLKTDKKSAELELKIKEDFVPNIYISVTLIRALGNTNLPLTVAHGFQPLTVEKPENRLPLEIIAPEKTRSRMAQNITVKSRPESDIEVTLAVVDEGILQLKNYKSPDPYNFFFQKRALEVNSYDLYAMLFPELSLRRSSTGGDGYDLEKRVNPMGNARVKLVAFWSGILHTNSKGEAYYKIDIPQFSGDLRIMAVAYKNKAFGAATKNMKVADPLVISTALPRFFSPGDALNMPVNITNTTKGSGNAVASVQVTGPLQVDGPSVQNLALRPDKEERVAFSIKAAQMIGEGTVTVTVRGLNETFTEKTTITVRPSTSLIKRSGNGSVQGGSNGTFSVGGDFIPGTQESKIIVSRSPMVQFVNRFDDLLGYPHGCLEQTISKAFPQIYFADFIKQVKLDKRPYAKSGENERNPNFNVQEAIRKIQGMQLYNGAMSMWPGGDYETWWGTAYAIHFMTEAQKAGFEVDGAVMSKAQEYLVYKVGTRSTETYRFWESEGMISRKYASREMAYSLYVLALSGKANRPAMNYYKANRTLLTEDSRYLLAAAFQLIGDEHSYKAILPSSLAGDRSDYEDGGSFSSPIRNAALALNTLLETDPQNAQIPSLAMQLSEQMNKSRYMSTQEAAFSFLALGKLGKQASEATVTATILEQPGKVLGNYVGPDEVITTPLKSSEIELHTKGAGTLYYFWQNEGLSATGDYVEEDSRIKVRKTFYNRFGQQISNLTFDQNDLVIVKISVSALQAGSIDNVVITDMLPAGFEIENPRLNETREMPWIKSQNTPQHFDIRDDRINLYTSVWGGNTSQDYYYMVRAVSKGTFKMGPVSADAMYNGQIHSYNGAGTVIVK